MIDPTLGLITGGSILGSALFGSQGQEKVDQARQAAIAAERERQAALDAEALKINTGAQDRYQNFGDQQTARAAQLSDFFKAPVTTPTTAVTTAPLPATTNALVQRDIDTKAGIANDYVTHQAETLGNLRSFGDLMGDINRAQGHDAQLVGQVGSFKKGSAGVNALELDAANHAGDNDRMISDLLGGISKIGTTAALSGGFSPSGGLSSMFSRAATSAPTAATSVFQNGASPFLNYGMVR